MEDAIFFVSPPGVSAQAVLNFSTRNPGGVESVPTPVSTNGIWRFGVYEVDTRRVELRRSGTVVKLREQSFLVLVYLLEHAGEIVTREELRHLLWPSDTFVDFDHSLSTAVMKLRDALGDSTDAPIYIETIPKRGYRFIAPVSQVPDSRNELANSQEASASVPAIGTNGAQQAAPAPAETPIPHRRLELVAAATWLILLAALGCVVFLLAHHMLAPAHDANQVSSAFKILPVTSAPGSAISPAISPDGREVAYLWDGPERRRDDVYVQLISSDRPLRLTYSKSGFLGPPAWSPHAREIAFTRCDGENNGVYTVPALGGEERKLTDVSCQFGMSSPLAWLADNKGILVIDRCSPAGPFGVVLFILATGEKQCLAYSGSRNPLDNVYNFALSPDGGTIAFHASDNAKCFGNIYTIPVSGGATRQLTHESDCFGDLMWTSDSKSIVFVSIRAMLPSLWRVPGSGGPAQPETVYPAIGSFSADGGRFVYSEQTAEEPSEIWRADLSAEAGSVLGNKRLIYTPYGERFPVPSPDGARLVWTSGRTGSGEIWMSDATGANPVQLTHIGGHSGLASWSPDGKWLALDDNDGKSDQVFVMDSEGRNLQAITHGPYSNSCPIWSRDGKSIYFPSIRTGTTDIWKYSVENREQAQLTWHGGVVANESYDGRTIFFSKVDQAGIWSMSASGGMESLIVAGKPQYGYFGYWGASRGGLYLLNAEAEPGPRIEFYNFATRRTSPVLKLEKKPNFGCPAISATTDGKTIYYTQFDSQSVIKMMEFSR